jgi:Zn-dependent M28 family amino/carboxypeptidase
MTAMLAFALLTLLQAAPATAPQATALVDDARRLTAAATNDARFDALTAILRSRGLTFTVEPFTIAKPVGREPRTEGRNVVLTIGEGSQDLVIGAHYDAVRLPDGSLSRGAVDNAASSVMLIRLAETLRAESLPLRIRVVWFDMEETGLIGSAQYVKQHATDQIAAMLNFDINAYGDTIMFGPAERPENAALRRAFVQTCAAEDIPCVGFAQMPPSDDRSFVRAGVPAISVAIVPAVDVHQLWLMMNAGAKSGLAEGMAPSILRTIHSPEDTPDKLNEEAMRRVQRFAVSLVRSITRRP